MSRQRAAATAAASSQQPSLRNRTVSAIRTRHSAVTRCRWGRGDVGQGTPPQLLSAGRQKAVLVMPRFDGSRTGAGGQAVGISTPLMKELTKQPSSDSGGAPGETAGGGATSGAFGAKTIGFWSSCCLNLNNVMGAAIVALPMVNQQAGWLTPTICIVFVFVVSSFASTMLVEAMQRIPGNAHLTQRWEFCAVVGHYHGPRAQRICSWLYNISLQSTNVAAMIVSAQLLDVLIIFTCGRSVALDYHVFPPAFITSEKSLADPWLTQWVISAGFLISMAIAIPLGYINLEENMKFQVRTGFR
jgi:hypothetical protein